MVIKKVCFYNQAMIRVESACSKIGSGSSSILNQKDIANLTAILYFFLLFFYLFYFVLFCT